MNHDLTHGEIYELRLCADWDYFTVRFGLTPTDFNQRVVSTDRKTILNYLLWSSVFKPFSMMGVFCNRRDLSMSFLKEFYDLYESSPNFLRARMRSRIKTAVDFENGSNIRTGWGENCFRGMTLNLLAVSDHLDSAKKKIIDEVHCPILFAMNSKAPFITFHG